MVLMNTRTRRTPPEELEILDRAISEQSYSSVNDLNSGESFTKAFGVNGLVAFGIPTRDYSARKIEFSLFDTRTSEPQKIPKITLQTLPVEIRLQIYDFLPIRKHDRKRCSRDQLYKLPRGSAKYGWSRQPSGLIALLETCSQIYREVVPVVYSQFVFEIGDPEEALKLIRSMGPHNTKLVRSMRFDLRSMVEKGASKSWSNLFNVIAREAIGLRFARLSFASYGEFRHRDRDVRGWGEDLDFIRAFAKIQGLNELVLQGYFAKSWPGFLSDKMKISVQTVCGHSWAPVTDDIYGQEDVDQKRWLLEENETIWIPQFLEFQRGTEHLDPWSSD